MMSETETQDFQAEYDRLSLEVLSGNADAEAELEELEGRIAARDNEQRRVVAAERARAAKEVEAQRVEDARLAEARTHRVRRLRDDYGAAHRRLDEAATEFIAAVHDLAGTGDKLFNEGVQGYRPILDAETALQTAALRDLPNRWARQLGHVIGSPPAAVRQQIARERGLLGASSEGREPLLESE